MVNTVSKKSTPTKKSKSLESKKKKAKDKENVYYVEDVKEKRTRNGKC